MAVRFGCLGGTVGDLNHMGSQMPAIERRQRVREHLLRLFAAKAPPCIRSPRRRQPTFSK